MKRRGRPPRHHHIRERCRTLSATDLRKAGVFTGRPGTQWLVRWLDPDGKPVSDTLMHNLPRGGQPFLHFSYYLVQPYTGALFNPLDQDGREPIHANVSLVAASCRFGGRRVRFFCPGYRKGERCRRRMEKLFIPPSDYSFGCPKCLDLRYNCQRPEGFREPRLQEKVQIVRLDKARRAGVLEEPLHRPEKGTACIAHSLRAQAPLDDSLQRELTNARTREHDLMPLLR